MREWNINNKDKFIHIKQKYENSCWAACAMMIINCVCGKNYKDEDKFIQMCDFTKYKINEQGNPIDLIDKVLEDSSYQTLYADNDEIMPLDDHPLPTAKEIKDHFKDYGTPLVCCVGEHQPTQKNPKDGTIMPDNEYSGGHWILIIGIQEDHKGYELIIADPTYKKTTSVRMNDTIYKVGVGSRKTLYWENTSYVNFKPC